MAKYQSTHTGAEIDEGIDLLGSNSATQGQVLTANGTGGASWQDMDMEIPIVAGEGITIDKQSAEGKVEVKLDTAFTDGKYVPKIKNKEWNFKCYCEQGLSDGSSKTVTVQATTGDFSNSIIQRDANGRAKINTPTADLDGKYIVNKAYVDDNFVPIAKGRLQLYGTDPSTAGKVHMYQITPTPTASGIPQYGTNGVLKVGTPVGQNDATTKAYVDGLQHYVHTISLDGESSHIYTNVVSKEYSEPITVVDVEDGVAPDPERPPLAAVLVGDVNYMATGIVRDSDGNIRTVIDLRSDGQYVYADYVVDSTILSVQVTQVDTFTITDNVV